MEYGAIDLHKKESQIRIVTEDGLVIDRRLATTRERLTAVFWGRPRMRILLEAATESEWVAQHLETLGHEVIVADPKRAHRTALPTYRLRGRVTAHLRRGRSGARRNRVHASDAEFVSAGRFPFGNAGAATSSVTDSAFKTDSRQITPKHYGIPAIMRDQRTRPANKINNRAKSAKPPSPVQIRAAPPNLLGSNSIICVPMAQTDAAQMDANGLQVALGLKADFRKSLNLSAPT
jgi:hypothetical protein